MTPVYLCKILTIALKLPSVSWRETLDRMLLHLKQRAAPAKGVNVSFTILYILQLSR
ncbi:hypothetical protein NIES4073_46290 [Kalymmatonema gypsitolerans NIES-4073]|uniref:hypothetical protein n=1 Tax=Scytonema sp. PRP1 TaxID=3120513 RepID=UPI000B602DE7|nr:hypothetical protein NIES4073_46290 [Scytonema sp. NIES-4073]